MIPSALSRAAHSGIAIAALMAIGGCFPELPGRAGGLADGEPPVGDLSWKEDARVGGRDAVVLDGDVKPDRALDPEPDVMPEPEPDGMPEPEPRLDMTPGPEPDGMPGPEPDVGLPDMAPDPDMLPPDRGPPPTPEVCNGLDDDGNGVVDDAPVCGRVIAERCHVYLGWADENSGPVDGSATWGACPDAYADDLGLDDRIACRGTRGEGRFWRIQMRGGVNDDDDVGIAFRCAGGPPGVAEWLQASCEVWIGQADFELADGAATHDDWGGCLAREGTGQPLDDGWVCDSSGRDGLFYRMSLTGGVNDDDAFGVAFRCTDADDPDRAAAAQASAAVFLAWDKWQIGGDAVDGGASWSDCPGERHDAVDNGGDERCASSAFDGRFHRFEVTGSVDGFDAFGIALLPHPDAP